MTSEMHIKMLAPEEVDNIWPKLEPMFEASCESNEVGILDITPDDIHILAVAGECAIFVGSEEEEPKVVVAIQFNESNGHKGADVIAMGGERLMKFKNAYWALILDWLKANGCEFLDAYANERLAKVYMSKFGFNKSCSYVRMTL